MTERDERVERLEQRILRLEMALSGGDGTIRAHHLRCWAEQIEGERRYTPEMAWWLRLVADAWDGRAAQQRAV